MSRTVAVVQARLGSQRLPGKVLLPLGDRTVLDWVLHRLGRATLVDEVVVATSDQPDDDPLAAHVESAGVAVFRGDLHDVLSRCRGAAESRAATTVERVTADCPLLDPDAVDAVVRAHRETGADFTANRLPPPHHRTWPIGLDVEVATIEALRRADDEATEPAHREHVMPYLYAGPGDFDVHVVECPLGDHGQSAGPSTLPTTSPRSAGWWLEAASTSTPRGRACSPSGRPTRALAALNAQVTQKSADDVDDRR